MEKDEIKAGEYVRTISGNIDKVDGLYRMIENTIHLKNHKWQSIKNIVKHSKNIIDLIEVGDYVNGKLIHKVDIRKDSAYVYYGNYKTFTDYQIKSILTKEQFEATVYKVGE